MHGCDEGEAAPLDRLLCFPRSCLQVLIVRGVLYQVDPGPMTP